MIQKNENLLFYSTWGSSMFPFIRSDDYILVKKVPLEMIRPGDAIVFESETKSKICHRVVEVKKKDNILWFYTTGYKNLSSGVPITEDRVLGKLIGIKRKAAGNIIKLPLKGPQILLFRFDYFLTENIFYIKRILARAPFIKKIYKYIVKKHERYYRRLL